MIQRSIHPFASLKDCPNVIARRAFTISKWAGGIEIRMYVLYVLSEMVRARIPDPALLVFTPLSMLDVIPQWWVLFCAYIWYRELEQFSLMLSLYKDRLA